MNTGLLDHDARAAQPRHRRTARASAVEPRATIGTTVAVLDTKSGEAFQIEVHAGERALDVFQHPFAYAAFRGITTAHERSARPPPLRDGLDRSRRPRRRSMASPARPLRAPARRAGRPSGLDGDAHRSAGGLPALPRAALALACAPRRGGDRRRLDHRHRGLRVRLRSLLRRRVMERPAPRLRHHRGPTVGAGPHLARGGAPRRPRGARALPGH